MYFLLLLYNLFLVFKLVNCFISLLGFNIHHEYPTDRFYFEENI